MDRLEAVAAGFEACWGWSSEEDNSDCRAVSVEWGERRRPCEGAGHHLFGGL